MAKENTGTVNLSKYSDFIDEISSLEGVTPQVLDYLITTPRILKTAHEDYERLKERIATHTHSDAQVEHILHQGNVPTMFLKARMEEFPEKVRKECNDPSLYLYGKAGTGKTHLAVALMREQLAGAKSKVYYSDYTWRQKTIRVPYFMSIPDLLLNIRDSFRETQTVFQRDSEADIIRKFSENRLFVFDDLGAEKTSEWSLQTLYTIIDRRYRELCPTIITSNLSLNDLAKRLGDRIASRIEGMCTKVQLLGKDRRVKA